MTEQKSVIAQGDTQEMGKLIDALTQLDTQAAVDPTKIFKSVKLVIGKWEFIQSLPQSDDSSIYYWRRR